MVYLKILSILTWFLRLESWWNPEDILLIQVNGVVPKGYRKGMMTLIELLVLCTPTYCKKQSVSLNTTKDDYIVAKKKASKDSPSNEEYDLEELYRWIWILYSYPFHHWIRGDALVGHKDIVLCDMWCKNICSVFPIMRKIEIGP